MIDVSAKIPEVHEITPQSNYAWIYQDGQLFFVPRFEVSVTHCSVDVTWFPFDLQRDALLLRRKRTGTRLRVCLDPTRTASADAQSVSDVVRSIFKNVSLCSNRGF